MHEQKEEWIFKDAEDLQHHYQWSNKLPIKQDQKADDFTFVHLLEYSVTDTNSNVLYYNTWMTDIYLHENNVKEVAAGGRARFKIENVTFNEQKRGCFIEHNFGHFDNLPNVFFGLVQIATYSQKCFTSGERETLIQKVGSQRRFWNALQLYLAA
ncbi:MAG: hypothetical protein H6625_02090 [Bdellovibrionaceae bacterium]|nr:hypothetical protein [Pseudobdellovibrionaceae bacterium]